MPAGKPSSATYEQSARAMRSPFSMCEAVVQIRIVDQSLPAHRGARLLEVHAHDGHSASIAPDPPESLSRPRILAGRVDVVDASTGPTTTNSRGSRRSRMARTISRELNTVAAAREVSGRRRLTSSGVANKSLDATLTFCN